MKSFILLLKIQLLGLFGINKALHANAAKAKRTLALAALVVAAVVLFASAYSAGGAGARPNRLGRSRSPGRGAGGRDRRRGCGVQNERRAVRLQDYDLVMSLPCPRRRWCCRIHAVRHEPAVRRAGDGAGAAQAFPIRGPWLRPWKPGLREAARDRAKDYSLGMKQRWGWRSRSWTPDVLLG
ncbi:MAG: hypothetical protein ACLSVD_07730 [Eggerthellaceae bacterium]